MNFTRRFLTAAIVLLTPTSQAITASLRPSRWLGAVIGVGLALALLKINNGVSNEFIYFQF